MNHSDSKASITALRRVLVYHVAVLYDAGLLNGSELADLESLAMRVNRQSAATRAAAAAGAFHYPAEIVAGVAFEHNVLSLFPFTAAAMHALYPAQYPKSDFQAPNSPWQKVQLFLL
jgi:hypothetical protein